MAGNSGMEKLIPMVNRLQDACAASGLSAVIDLPQIAVVGAQSAGKSSVLENFVGRDFLPRGSGIVTRRPLILQLMNSRHGEWGEFLHCKGKKFTNFEEIRAEIEAETDRGTGQNKGISPVPINLRVFSPRVLNLTLVDLPGMTKVAVGDQPVTIEKDIRDMILQFITKENCLILAVSPANSDLANSDALQIAKSVDPQGLRTLGVMLGLGTKLDLMDQGTDAKEILENRLLPLRRGYIGVVNRSQRDIDGRKDITAALRAERQFFLTHPSYSHMADRMGTAYLQKKLNEQLTNHIKDKLPQFRDGLSKQLAGLEKDVKDIKDYKPNDPSRSTKQMLKLINGYAESVEAVISGGEVDDDNPDELNSGAKIRKIFTERLPLAVIQVEKNPKQLRNQIRITILNYQAIGGALFTPDKAFDSIAKKEIEKLRNPALNTVDLVIQEYMQFLRDQCKKMASYPRLSEEVDRIIATKIREQEQIAKNYIDYLIDTELAYMNTSHPDFLKTPNVGRGPAEGNVQSQSKDNSEQMIRKGWLTLNTGGFGGKKDFWFVLTTQSLAWYKDDEQKEKKYLMPLSGLRVRDVRAKNFMASKFAFQVYHENGHNVFKDHRTLDLATDSDNHLEEWKASFLRAGVFPERDEEAAEAQEATQQKKEDRTAPIDPVLERQVETIRAHVESYLEIVKTTIKDRVPKIIMFTIVHDVRTFCKMELLGNIYASAVDIKTLMEESHGEAERREALLKMYHGLKDALQIISDINVNTNRADEPPPVNDDWRKATPISQSSYQQPRQPPMQPMQNLAIGGPSRPPPVNRPVGGPGGPPNIPRRPIASPNMAGNPPMLPARPRPGGAPPLPNRPGGPVTNTNSLI